MSNYIYADNAATTQLDRSAYEAMSPYLLESYGNPSQPYSFSRAARKAIKEARKTIADCIGATPEEIYFTSGGTESNNWALNATAKNGLITSEIEHHAVINPCKLLQRKGLPVYFISANEKGAISPNSLESFLREKSVGLVSIMTANNEIGTIEPIAELCEVTHKYGAIFHTDAVQAIGHIEFNVKELGIDMMSASAHKFNGPKGIGFLYIRKGLEVCPYLLGGSQEKNLRAGTENVASIVGMAVALRKNCDNLQSNMIYLSGLEERLISKLDQSGTNYVLNGSTNRLPGLMSLSFEGQDGEAILHKMDLMKIAISTGSACDSKRTEISHVLRAIGLKESLAKGTIRVSLCKNNTLDEVDTIVNALIKVIQK